MPITKSCCDNRAVKRVRSTCATSCCKVIAAWTVDCQYITAETVETAQDGLCAIGTFTGWTVSPALTKILHVLDLDTSYTNTFKYSTNISDSNCIEYTLESEFKVEYATPDQICAVSMLQGTRSPVIVQTTKPDFAFYLLNYDGDASWTMEQDSVCSAKLKLNTTKGTRGAVIFQSGGTDAATETFITNNLNTD